MGVVWDFLAVVLELSRAAAGRQLCFTMSRNLTWKQCSFE